MSLVNTSQTFLPHHCDSGQTRSHSSLARTRDCAPCGRSPARPHTRPLQVSTDILRVSGYTQPFRNILSSGRRKSEPEAAVAAVGHAAPGGAAQSTHNEFVTVDVDECIDEAVIGNQRTPSLTGGE